MSKSVSAWRRQLSSVRVIVPGAVLLLFLALAVSLWGDMRDRQIALVNEREESEMRVILLQMQSALNFAASTSKTSHGLQRLVSATASDPKVVSAHLLDTKGRVLASTRIADIGTQQAEESVLERGNAGAVIGVKHEGRRGKDLVIGEAMIQLGAGIGRLSAQDFGRLRLVRDYSRAKTIALIATDEAMTRLVMIVVPLVLLTALFLHWRITLRLQRVTAAARRFGEGHLVEEVRVFGFDEIAHLARDLEDMAQARSNLEDQLRQSQKMESIGLLAGGVAHDFNNLLTVIIAAGQLARLQSTHESVKEHLDDLIDAADRAAALTSQLLAFGRKQTLSLVCFDLNMLCLDTAKMMERLVGEQIQLVRDLMPGLALVSADEDQLSQVLVNLVVNARDAMEKGGTLTIGTRLVELDQARADMLLLSEGEHICLSVRDEGVGMDSATCARIFEPFFTTKDKDKGTGLGLSTAYGIVRQCKGAIQVESEPGVGTTFSIFLPVASDDEDASNVPAVRSAKAGTAVRSATILLVEDESMVSKFISKILSDAGYTIVTANGHQQALQQFSKHQDEIALLLTDVVLPGPGGPEIATELLAKKPSLRVLYMSGYTDGALDVAGMVPEHVALLRKPFRAESLVEQVNRQLADLS